MMRRLALAAPLVALLALLPGGMAAGDIPRLDGPWGATSSTALSITGDIAIGHGRLATRRGALPMVLTRTGDDGGDPSWIARAPLRAGRALMNGNTFCGAGRQDSARWLTFTALPQSGRGSASPGLRLMAFQTAQAPAALHGEATPGVCAVFYFSRRAR